MKIAQRLNTHTRKLLAMSVCLIPAIGVAAEDLSYTYAEVDYINLDVDQPGEKLRYNDWDDGSGYGIKGSVAVTPSIFVYGEYSESEADFSFTDNNDALVPGNTDLVRLNFGLGYVLPMNTTTDLVFSGGYSDIDFDRFRLGASGDSSLNDLRDDPSDGFTIDGKLRSQLTPSLEGSLGARYTDIDNFDGVSLIGSLMYEFTPNWGLNVSLDAGDELMTWSAGVRYSF